MRVKGEVRIKPHYTKLYTTRRYNILPVLASLTVDVWSTTLALCLFSEDLEYTDLLRKCNEEEAVSAFAVYWRSAWCCGYGTCLGAGGEGSTNG